MSMDELLKGLAVFQDGMKQYAVASAVNDANQQLTQLNQMEGDKLQAQTQISQNLAMRLGAAGADASHIQALTGEIAPSQGAQFQAGVQKDMQAQSQAFNASEAQKQRNLQWDMQTRQLDALSGKSAQKMPKVLSESVDKFAKNHQKQLDILNQMETYKTLIDTNPSQIGIELAKTGLLKGAGEDRVSDKDLPRVVNDPSWRAAAARRLNIELTGNALKDDRKFYSAIISQISDINKQQIEKRLKGEVTARKTAYGDLIDETQYETALRAKVGLSPQQQMSEKDQAKAANEQKVQRLKAWLASPEAKKNPSKADAALKALNRLQQGQ